VRREQALRVVGESIRCSYIDIDVRLDGPTIGDVASVVAIIRRWVE
jgi:hypothetical protein